MKDVQGFISIFGKPYYLVIALWFIGVTGGIVWILKNPIFNKVEHNQILIVILFLIAAIVGVPLSIKAKREDLKVAKEKELRAKEDAKELEEYKFNLSIKEKQDEVIGEAKKVLRDWISNPPQGTKTHSLPYNYNVKLVYKVMPTGTKYGLLFVDGVRKEREKLS